MTIEQKRTIKKAIKKTLWDICGVIILIIIFSLPIVLALCVHWAWIFSYNLHLIFAIFLDNMEQITQEEKEKGVHDD